MNEIFKKRLIAGSKGKAILFAGAGCSIDCLNYGNKELPLANPLLGVFNKALGKKYSRLDIAAAKYLDADKKGYLTLLNNAFFVRSVPDDLVQLLEYDWSRIYTTNYDNALEVAAQQAGKSARPLVPGDDYSLQPVGNLQIVHLHGYIERFDLENVKQDCILDYNSNVANKVYDGPSAERLRLDLDNADIIVFVGYSLYDPEIAKLVKSSHTKDKVFFINSMHPNEELEYMQEQYGDVKSIGRDGFVKILNSAAKQAGKKSRQSYVCFDTAEEFETKTDGVRQTDLHDLFLLGKYSRSKAQADISNNTQSYIVKRDLIEKISTRLSDSADFIIVFSRLGQGKTVLAKTLAATLRAKIGGQSVFFATRNQIEFASELQEIIKEHNRPIIILDDFFRYKKHWATIAALGGEKVQIIATVRQNVFSTRQREIDETFLNHTPEVFELGELSHEEGKALVPLITQAGLWQADAAMSDIEKLNKIRNKFDAGYHNNFADILLGLMKSNDIVARFKKELSILKEISQKCYEGVLLIIYLEFTNNDPDVTLLQEGFGNDLKEFVSNQDTEGLLRVFLIPDSRGIRYKSSVFSNFALEHACDPNDVVKVIKSVVERLATSPDISNDYDRLLGDLMRYNYIKKLSFDNDHNRIHRFYDELSALPEINKNDLFWNAFGMCERARGDLPAAMKHFRTSIANAKNRGPNYIPYHAQNQLTVSLLEYGIQEDLPAAQALSDLIECIKFLKIQADDERTHGTGQAFAWHSQVGSFVDKYLQGFDGSQRSMAKAHLLKYMNFIKQKVIGWDNRGGASRMVSELSRITRNLSEL